jgi:transposase
MSITDAAAGPPAADLPDTAALPDDVATLKSMIRELLVTLRAERHNGEALQQRIHLLLQRLYGRKSERFDPNQLQLFTEDAPPQPAAASETDRPARKRRCRPHGRRRLPEDLPRRPLEHILSDAERICVCGQARVDIGIDVSEQLDWQPASYFVWQHRIHKYLCLACAGKATTEAAPVEPIATEPIAAEPIAAEPIPTEPIQAEPILAEPFAAEPIATEPIQAEPIQPELIPAELIPAEPIPAEPIPAEPIPAEPIPTAPAATVPAAGAPAAAEPAPRPIGPAIISAPKPPMPIDKGLPGPGLLAHIIVSKYFDHLPLYRQENISQRQGVLIPRSTSSDWMAACAELLRPLYDLMVASVLQSRWLHTDDTSVKNLGHEPGTTATAHLWIYYGDREHCYNVFDFTLNRQRDGPQTFLTDFHGYLHADAFSGYDALYLPRPRAGTAPIIEVACNAHARRKFHEARGSAALHAHQALAYYAQLYDLERAATANNFDDAQRWQMRQDLSVPILDKFKTWLDEQRPQVLPKSPMAEAMGYALNNWTALIRYTEAGFLSIDNNVAEREMKRIAIGRKNWLFVGSAKGGATAAVLYSFTSTCHRLKIDPWAYLQDVLTRLPRTPAANLSELLPDRWQTARQESVAATAAATNSPPVP